MTQQLSIEEGNKLIAKFDGKLFTEFNGSIAQVEEVGGSPWEYDPIIYLEYNNDWSLLMPVVEKISQTVIKGHPPFNSDQLVKVEIVTSGYVKISNLRDTPISSNVSIEGSLIKAVWVAVIRFIQWYNRQLYIVDIKAPSEEAMFFAVEYAGYWHIQKEPYYTGKNILNAEDVGTEAAERSANLIVELLNKHHGTTN